jgi:hypothetical protein
MIVGRLGAEAIGAVDIGSTFFFTAAVFGVGILLGLDIVVAQAFGAGRLDDGHRVLVQGGALTGRAPRRRALRKIRRTDFRRPDKTTTWILESEIPALGSSQIREAGHLDPGQIRASIGRAVLGYNEGRFDGTAEHDQWSPVPLAASRGRCPSSPAS